MLGCLVWFVVNAPFAESRNVVNDVDKTTVTYVDKPIYIVTWNTKKTTIMMKPQGN